MRATCKKDMWISDAAYVVVSRNGPANRFLIRSSRAMPTGNRTTVLGSGAGTGPAIAWVSDNAVKTKWVSGVSVSSDTPIVPVQSTMVL